MSEAVRLYKYQALLANGRPVSRERLLAAGEVSLATLKRDLTKLRDQFDVPIEFDREMGGYVIRNDGNRHELPGLWLTQEEIIALATIQKMIAQLAPTILGLQLAPLEHKLNELLSRQGLTAGELSRRVKLMNTGNRDLEPGTFESVAYATFMRKRLEIRHFNRSTGQHTNRIVSPLDITLYKGNWYLNAWCHQRDEPRRFSIDAIESTNPLEVAAIEMSDEDMQSAFDMGFGIFAGRNLQIAVVIFSPERARWVQQERWHRDQVGELMPDGRYKLNVPYSDERELVANLMSFGDQATVLEPVSLINSLTAALTAALDNYSCADTIQTPY